MQLLNPLCPYLTEIDAYAQSLKLWVLEVCAWLVVLMDSRTGRIELRKMMMKMRSDLRALIFLKIVARMRFRPRAVRAAAFRPGAAPRGFRHVRRQITAMKVLTRRIRLKTLDDLKRVLRTLDDVVARALARLPRTANTWGIVAVAPPARVLAPCAPAPAPDGADTS